MTRRHTMLFALVVSLSLGMGSLAGNPATAPQMFVTADQCMACHNGLTAPDGSDVSFGTNWRSSMMAHAARDPYWQAAVRREILEHPESAEAIQNECAACHMPMSRTQENAQGQLGRIFAHLPVNRGGTPLGLLAVDGVSCSACHQIQEDHFGEKESFTGGFVFDSKTPWNQRQIFGPYEVDPGRQALMQSVSGFLPSESIHVQRSELCATCHTLYTHALGPDGEVVGELPEQVPYLEWKHSDYQDSMSCQTCHMPVVSGATEISSVLGVERTGVSRHVFRGGNFFMLRLLSEYRAELGVDALPQELATTAASTREFLQSETARLALEGLRVTDGKLVVDVVIDNLAGHKLPTAYPSRRAWLRVTVEDGSGRVVFESGRLSPDGSIAGNDNDADPRRYEPHYEQIETQDQVQIYEAIMVAPDDEVTTGLLRAVRFVKDNRLLPLGFDKATAPEDVAVQGGALRDDDFQGGGESAADRVRYRVDLGTAEGPFTVLAELWYQPIGYRWAHNLESHDAPETDRFVRQYEALADVSGIVLARAETVADGS